MAVLLRLLAPCHLYQFTCPSSHHHQHLLLSLFGPSFYFFFFRLGHNKMPSWPQTCVASHASTSTCWDGRQTLPFSACSINKSHCDWGVLESRSVSICFSIIAEYDEHFLKCVLITCISSLRGLC